MTAVADPYARDAAVLVLRVALILAEARQLRNRRDVQESLLDGELSRDDVVPPAGA